MSIHYSVKENLTNRYEKAKKAISQIPLQKIKLLNATELATEIIDEYVVEFTFRQI